MSWVLGVSGLRLGRPGSVLGRAGSSSGNWASLLATRERRGLSFFWGEEGDNYVYDGLSVAIVALLRVCELRYEQKYLLAIFLPVPGCWGRWGEHNPLPCPGVANNTEDKNADSKARALHFVR